MTTPKKPRTHQKNVAKQRTRHTFAAGASGLAETTVLRVADLHTATYQRPLDEHWVAAIAEQFNPALFEPLHVALRADNNYYVVDGQHRLEAAKRRNMTEVPVLLHLDTTEADEAAQFVLLQERRARLLQQDRFHARVVAGEPTALAISAVLAAHGFSVTRLRVRARNAFMATAALEEAFRKGTLSDVLGIMRDAWDGSPESLNASFVRGLAVFLARYGTQIRRAEFIEKLRSIEVRDILLRAQIIAQSMRAPTMTGVAQALLDVYNQKRSTFRLEGGFI